MIQSQNDYIQSQNNSFHRLEAQMGHLVNTINVRNEKLSLSNFWPFPTPLAILIGIKNHGVLETLTNDQSQTLNRLESFHFKKIELEYDVTLMLNFVIQF